MFEEVLLFAHIIWRFCEIESNSLIWRGLFHQKDALAVSYRYFLFFDMHFGPEKNDFGLQIRLTIMLHKNSKLCEHEGSDQIMSEYRMQKCK